MNKTELIANVAEMSEITKKDAEKVVKAMFECISETLAKGEKVQIIGFGTFEVRERKAREGHNPSNPSKSPAFKAGKQLKERVNVKPAKKARRK